MNVAQIIDAIVSEGGFDTDETDTSRTVILGWVQTRYDLALTQSKWRRMTLSLGSTVVGQAQYAIPAQVVEFESLRVGGSAPWLRVTLDELVGLATNDGSYLTAAAGAYGPNFEPDGDKVVELWPTPSVAGLAITCVAVCTDTTALADGAGSTPALPTDLHRRLLVKGGIAEGLSTIEKRADMAASFEGEFGQAVKELKSRAVAQVRPALFRARVGGR